MGLKSNRVKIEAPMMGFAPYMGLKRLSHYNKEASDLFAPYMGLKRASKLAFTCD